MRIFCAAGTAVVLCAIFGCHSPDASRSNFLSCKQESVFRNPSTPKQNEVCESQSTIAVAQQKTQNLSGKTDADSDHLAGNQENLKKSPQSNNAILDKTDKQTQKQPLPILPDDLPEIAEFAKVIESNEHYSYPQKLEILEILRKESPEMRSYMIANFLGAISVSAKNKTKNPIVSVSHQIPTNGEKAELYSIRQAAFDTDVEEEVEEAEKETPQNQERLRLVQANRPQSNIASFRNNRIQSELTSTPRIIINPALRVPAADSNVSDNEKEIYEEENETELYEGENVKKTNPRAQALNVQTTLPYLNIREEPEEESEETDSEFLPLANDKTLTQTQIGFSNLRGNDSRFSANQTVVPLPETKVSEHDSAISPGKNHSPPNRAAAAEEAENYKETTQPFRSESPNESITRAVNTLNAQLEIYGNLEQKDRIGKEIYQRLLNLTLGNQREAIKPINGLPYELQEFWRNELLGLSTLLDEKLISDPPHRYAVAQHHLQTAGLYLQNLCPVRIKNMNFINECDGYGVYKAAKNEFRNGDPMFIYAEIDNLVNSKQETVYQTKVRSNYEIVDTQGNNIMSGEFGDVGKETQSRIRDAFLLMRVDLPENIAPGKYFMKVTITDLNHPKFQFDQQRLDLNVVTQQK
ncbi:MAG: hypothetical protein LBT05_02510 [Planctomycetaceae bacterium]|jgi:hypothetical protein|nr:hypothetical protein [Planctomycetaceae bacterium]